VLEDLLRNRDRESAVVSQVPPFGLFTLVRLAN